MVRGSWSFQFSIVPQNSKYFTLTYYFFTARRYASAVPARTCRRRVSVSVTSRCSTKMAERRITRTTPHAQGL